MKQLQRGFTLIELMIVVAIVGILAAIAVPAFQEYTATARVSEALALGGSAKTAVAETFLSQNAVPDQAATGFASPAPTANLASLTIANDGSGTITITTTAAAGGGSITMVPTLVTGSKIAWDCTGGTLDAKYRPAVCRP